MNKLSLHAIFAGCLVASLIASLGQSRPVTNQLSDAKAHGPTSRPVMRVVYLCDASGSMLSTFGELRLELKKSISRLTPDQSFDVIFFSDDRAISLSPHKLLPADVQGVVAAFSFIDNATSSGGTSPQHAIDAAFARRPDIIYLASDGLNDDASHGAEPIKRFREKNSARKVRVNCIMFGHSEDAAAQAVMRKIAIESGGTFDLSDSMKKLVKTTDDSTTQKQEQISPKDLQELNDLRASTKPSVFDENK